MAKKRGKQQARPGLALDSEGGPVVDPTKNVFDLVTAETRRQDDLREKDAEHFREIIAMNRDHDRELRAKETDRLDAIRAVDVANAQRTVDVQATLAQTLQAQVASTAEAMRTQQAQQQQQNAEGLASVIKPLVDRIGLVEQQMWQGRGAKDQVVESRDTRGDNRGQLTTLVYVVLAVLTVIGFVIARTS